MPRLPTADALGYRDPSARYQAPTYPTSDPALEASQRMGAAVSGLGNTLTSIGVREFEDEKKKRDLLEWARADADVQGQVAKLNEARDNETDPEKLSGYEAAHRSIVDGAAKGMSDPDKAALWRTKHDLDITRQGITASGRAKKLRNDAALAADDERLNGLELEAEKAGTPEALSQVIGQGRNLIDMQSANGLLDQRRAAAAKRALSERFLTRYLQTKPPSERVQILGEDEPVPAGNADMATAIRWGAKQLGISPTDLATVISYETGGTFSTSIRGGAGNRHIGLIQFGETEQKQYGANQKQTPAEQMGAVVRYLSDRGLKPGMGLLDLYSTINAGRPGLYNASDAGNGGAPGTVRDKVEKQMGGHKAKAAALIGADEDAPATIQQASIDGGASPGSAPTEPPKASGKFGPNDVYSLIPEKDAAGRDQIQQFKSWNADPIGNHPKLLSAARPQMADVIRKAQEDNPGLRFVIGSGGRTEEDQRKAVEFGWSPAATAGTKKHPFDTGGTSGTSKHLNNEAVDLWPVTEDGKVKFDPEQQAAIGAAVKKAAADLGVPLKWGGDFSGKKDLPHFQLEPGYEKIQPRAAPAATDAPPLPPARPKDLDAAGDGISATGEADASARADGSFGSASSAPAASPQSQPSAPDPIRAAVSQLPYEVRQRLRAQARSEVAQQKRDDEKAMATEKASVQSLIRDDLASVERTGQGVSELTGERIGKAFGSEAALEWEGERGRARRVYEAMDGAESLSDAALQQRLKGLEPKPGTAGYAEDMKTYLRADKKVRDLVEARNRDPALSVDVLPNVKAARASVRYDARGAPEPNALEGLVGARMAAQRQLGIVDPMAVTRSEAMVIAGKLRKIGEDDGVGLDKYLRTMRQAYGEYADEALVSALQLQGVNRDLSVAATEVLGKIMNATTPGAARSAIDAMPSVRSSPPAPVSTVPVQPVRLPPTPSPKSSPSTPQGAPSVTYDAADLKRLWNNRGDPEEGFRFDQKYSRGAALKILGDLSREFGVRPTDR